MIGTGVPEFLHREPTFEFLYWAKGEVFEDVILRSRSLREGGDFEPVYSSSGHGMYVAHSRTRDDYKTFTMTEGDLVVFIDRFVFRFYRGTADLYRRYAVEAE